MAKHKLYFDKVLSSFFPLFEKKVFIKLKNKIKPPPYLFCMDQGSKNKMNVFCLSFTWTSSYTGGKKVPL